MRVLMASVLFALSAVVAKAQTYTVLVQDYASLPPYSAYENGEYTGFNRKILDLFAESRGYEFEYIALPVRRLFVEFVAGAGDLKYPDNPSWALHIKGDAPIVYSDAVVNYVNGVMVHPDTIGGGIERIRRLGLVAGWTPVGYQDSIERGDVELLENNSYKGLLRQAMMGRVDGAYSNVATSRYYLEHDIGEPTALVFDQALPHIRATRVVASIKHPDLIAEFNAFLEDNAAEIQKLKERFGVERGIEIQ